MKYELWLDESGNFLDKSNAYFNPSLVGGLLVPENEMDSKIIDEVINVDYVHSTEMSNFGLFALNVLNKLSNYNSKFIVFENQERLLIGDTTKTYLNILSEGIVKLLLHLATLHKKFELNILIAIRLDVEKQEDYPGRIIYSKEYLDNLNERISLALAKRALTSQHTWSWAIDFASARKDKRLMIADVICNTWLTRTSRKFDDKQREAIEYLYKDTVYPVFEAGSIIKIKNLVAENNISEAIFEFCSNDVEKRSYLRTLIENRLISLNSVELRYQLLNLKNRIAIFIQVDKQLVKSEKLILQIIEIIDSLKKHKIFDTVIEFDMYMFLLTIYSHRGNINDSERILVMCEDLIGKLTNRWETIDYFFMLKLRKAIHYVNSYDVENAIAETTSVIGSLADVVDLFTLIDGLSDIFVCIKSEALGKAYGTRIQAYLLDAYSVKELINFARMDSELAIKQFTSSSDISRQFQYRSQIECEDENYLEARKYLYRSVEVLRNCEVGEENYFEVLASLDNTTKVFHLMHYLRIMAYKSLSGYENTTTISFVDNQFKLPLLVQEFGKNDHPIEILYWRLGTIQMMLGQLTSAENYFSLGKRICFHSRENYTLISIGVAMLAEETWHYARLKEVKKFEESQKQLIKKYKKFMDLKLPLAMELRFRMWDKIINIVTINEYQRLLELARSVGY